MQNQITNPDAEISLSQVADKVKGLFNSLNNAFFNMIQFVIRNIVIIIALIVIGAGLGTYLDMENKIFTHKIIVMPNFKSVNYLYEEVNRINEKVKEHDYIYLKKIGIPNPKRIVKIEVEAIVDIYEFIDDNGGVAENDSKFQLFKLISENGDMNKMLEDNTTSKYYKNHVITITTKGSVTQENLITPFLSHLENNAYFKALQKIYFSNLAMTTATNDSIANQIDTVIRAYAASSQGTNNNNLVSLNEKTSINELLKTKQLLSEIKAYGNIKSIDNSKVIKDNGILLNTKVSNLGSSSKVVLPLLFLFMFIVIYNFRKYYKNEINKRKAAANV